MNKKSTLAAALALAVVGIGLYSCCSNEPEHKSGLLRPAWILSCNESGKPTANINGEPLHITNYKRDRAVRLDPNDFSDSFVVNYPGLNDALKMMAASSDNSCLHWIPAEKLFWNDYAITFLNKKSTITNALVHISLDPARPTDIARQQTPADIEAIQNANNAPVPICAANGKPAHQIYLRNFRAEDNLDRDARDAVRVAVAAAKDQCLTPVKSVSDAVGAYYGKGVLLTPIRDAAYDFAMSINHQNYGIATRAMTPVEIAAKRANLQAAGFPAEKYLEDSMTPADAVEKYLAWAAPRGR